MFTWLKKLFSKRGRSNVIMKTALTWEQAKSWMVLGAKVRHIDWPEGSYIYMKDGIVLTNYKGKESVAYMNDMSETIGNPFQVV